MDGTVSTAATMRGTRPWWSEAGGYELTIKLHEDRSESVLLLVLRTEEGEQSVRVIGASHDSDLFLMHFAAEDEGVIVYFRLEDTYWAKTVSWGGFVGAANPVELASSEGKKPAMFGCMRAGIESAFVEIVCGDVITAYPSEIGPRKTLGHAYALQLRYCEAARVFDDMSSMDLSATEAVENEATAKEFWRRCGEQHDTKPPTEENST